MVVRCRFAPVQYPSGEQVLNSTLQAQAKRFPVPRIAGVPHDAADEIVRRDMRPEFLLPQSLGSIFLSSCRGFVMSGYFA